MTLKYNDKNPIKCRETGNRVNLRFKDIKRGERRYVSSFYRGSGERPYRCDNKKCLQREDSCRYLVSLGSLDLCISQFPEVK
jgi:hypothetical protein